MSTYKVCSVVSAAFLLLSVFVMEAHQAERLKETVMTLCSEPLADSERDSAGVNKAALYLEDRLKECGLKAFDGSHIQHFNIEGIKGANIIGMLEGYDTPGCDRYVIVGTHYDRMLHTGGKFYPDADTHASSLAVMLEVAAELRTRRDHGAFYDTHVIFVAFDRFLEGRLGSGTLWSLIDEGRLTDPQSLAPISADKIDLMIEIDQIGCTLAPVHKNRKDYIIALGEKSLPANRQGALERSGREHGIGLEINDSYYGSAKFTKVFYRWGDQRQAVDRGIPTIFFTSGITDNNNTSRDTPRTINWEIMGKRADLIFRFIENIL